MNRFSPEYNRLRRLWFRKVFWRLMLAGFVAIEIYLIFFKTGGFSNTDNTAAHALERAVFGSLFLLPVLMPIWAFLCFLICTAGHRFHSKRQGHS